MTLVFAGLLLVALWLARRLAPHDRAVYLSDKWRLERILADGKRRDL